MLYVVYGEHADDAREKAHALLLTLEKKKPDAALFKFDSDNWNEAQFEELIGGQGLFERKYIVFLSGVFADKAAKELLLARAKEIKASENVFIVLEGRLDKATLGKLEKAAEKVQAFGTAGEAKKPKSEFNIFSLTDALGRRDKKNLWVLYQKALEAEASPEEIHGILFWQVKSLILAGQAASAKEAGLAPFVFMKAKGFLKNFKTSEVRELSKKLVRLYAEARRGAVEFEIGLEQFILSI